MHQKQPWTGVAPSPAVLGQLDPEQLSVLALLAWSTATNRPVTSQDVAEVRDRNGRPLGHAEAITITDGLSRLKVASVLGMRNDKPLGIFLGGFQPRGAARAQTAAHSRGTEGRFSSDRRPDTRPQFREPHAGQPRPSGQRGPGRPGPRADKPVPRHEGDLIEHKWAQDKPQLRTTNRTPAFVLREATQLKADQARVESKDFPGDQVAAAEERLRILKARVGLYERWRKVEPRHDVLPAFLARKRKALPELEYQLERSRVKKTELESEQASGK